MATIQTPRTLAPNTDAHDADAAITGDPEVTPDPPLADGRPDRVALGKPTTARHPTPVTQVREDTPRRNRLLTTLPENDLVSLRRHLTPVRLQTGETLYEPEVPIRYVYFPETAVVSLVSRLGGRGSVEVGTIGCEGMVGLPVFLAADTSTSQALVQIPGTAQRMEAQAFVRLAAPPSAFHHAILRYTQAFVTQVAQTAVCNTAHLVEERCARWLLMTRDRVHGNQFALRYEVLAAMLAVRIGGVMMAMRKLQGAGLILYEHERVSILDRPGLEAAACECYGVMRAHFDRLLPAGGDSMLSRIASESGREGMANPPGQDAVGRLDELSDELLRCALRAEHQSEAFDTHVSEALGRLCEEAHTSDIYAEELLIALKTRWSRLPEATRVIGERKDVLLARVISLCIRVFYARETPSDNPEVTRDE